MNIRTSNWREKRNILNQGITFSPITYSIANYSTERKSDMRTSFEPDFLDRIHSIPDPLKKNLADSLITTKQTEKMPPTPDDFCYPNDINTEMDQHTMNNNRSDYYPSLTGITNFFTNFFGAISGAMFHKRPKSPVSQYYDCFDTDSDNSQERSPPSPWQAAKFEDQNKNGQAPEQFASVNSNDNMNNCRAAVAQCEDKLNSVRNLLTSKTIPNKPKVRPRRPRKLFVEPAQVEECFEDAFTPEDFVSLANEEYIEYFSISSNQKEELCEIDGPIMKTDIAPVPECTVNKVVPQASEKLVNIVEISKESDSTEKQIDNVQVASSNVINNSVVSKTDEKQEIILSCEDKMARLKSLLQEKRKKTLKCIVESIDTVEEPAKENVSDLSKKPTKTIPIEKKHDKRFKNPNRLSSDKRKQSKLRKNIQEDMLFAQEIDSESSLENSPISHSNLPLSISTLPRVSETCIEPSQEKEYFDEIKGRFRSCSTTDSEDSFQIVFTDSPKLPRVRKPSDCDSEDSFIVFEESPDSCYTSNDVFGDESDSDCSDSESDVSDSGCGASEVCKMSHAFSRTVSDLTDDSLYDETKTDDRDDSEDEVDSSIKKVFEEIPHEELKDLDLSAKEESAKPGLLLNEAKKLLRKDQPPKKVSFSTRPPAVRVMRVWAFAARQARAGHWERHALDRDRFKRRIADVDMAVSWVLKPQHRARVMFQRFNPWWNQLRRKELAEKKLRAEEEKVRLEEERVQKEEESKRIEEERVQKEEEDTRIEEEKLRLCGNGVHEEDGTMDVQNEKGIVSVSNTIQIEARNAIDNETIKASKRNSRKAKEIKVKSPEVNVK